MPERIRVQGTRVDRSKQVAQEAADLATNGGLLIQLRDAARIAPTGRAGAESVLIDLDDEDVLEPDQGDSPRQSTVGGGEDVFEVGLGNLGRWRAHAGVERDDLPRTAGNPWQALLFLCETCCHATVRSHAVHRRFLRRPRGHSPKHAFAPVGGAGSPPTRRAIPERDARHVWTRLTWGFAIK